MSADVIALSRSEALWPMIEDMNPLLDRVQAGHQVRGAAGGVGEGRVLRRGAAAERQRDRLLDLRLRPVGLRRRQRAVVELTLAAGGGEAELGQVGLLLRLRGVERGQLAGLELARAHQVRREGRGEDRLLLRHLFLHAGDEAHDPDGVGQRRVVAARGDFVFKREQLVDRAGVLLDHRQRGNLGAGRGAAQGADPVDRGDRSLGLLLCQRRVGAADGAGQVPHPGREPIGGAVVLGQDRQRGCGRRHAARRGHLRPGPS